MVAMTAVQLPRHHRLHDKERGLERGTMPVEGGPRRLGKPLDNCQTIFVINNLRGQKEKINDPLKIYHLKMPTANRP